MMPMSEQIRRMRQQFPAFEIVFNGGWHVVWEGPLRPLARTYWVRVNAVEPRQIDNLRVLGTCGAHVTLVAPELELISDFAPGESTPHLYWNQNTPTKSRLCLFDPATEEWTRDMALADTIIPWTIDWLASYEGWRATGIWAGGGRHPVVAK
jgi:hypothetical protein